MSNFKYRSNVTEEQFQAALKDLHTAILKKDTPEEWAKFTGKTLLLVGKIALSQFGLGPVVTLVEEVFGDDAEVITKILKMLEENTNEDV